MCFQMLSTQPSFKAIPSLHPRLEQFQVFEVSERTFPMHSHAQSLWN